MANGRGHTPEQPTSRQGSHSKRDLANQRRLEALGEAVDQRSGALRRRRNVRPHRVRRRIIIASVSLLAAVAAVVGGGYLYANWRFDQIHRVTVKYEASLPLSGQPFNILMIGSD